MGSYWYTPAEVQITCPVNTPETSQHIATIIEQQDINLERELIEHFNVNGTDVRGIIDALDDFSIACQNNRKKRNKRDRRTKTRRNSE